MGHEAQIPLLQELRAAVGEAWVRRGEPERIAYSSDMWPRHQIWKLGGEPARHPPDVVVWPADEAEVAAVVTACSRFGVPIVPYGAGSGVCGGAVPIRGGVVVDLKRLDTFHAVDDHDLTVTAGPGIIGMHLEEELAERGYTLGHFPSSILCSTLGGWLAARSAGQFSSRYGKIEDMVVSMRVVLADGRIIETGEDQPFDWTQIIVGSEGTLGLITQATLRVHPKPEASAFRGYRFRSLDDAIRGIRLVMQAGLAPHVVRLYDPFDSLLHSSSGGQASSMLDPIRDVLGGRVASFGKRAGRKLGIALALSVPGLLNRAVDSVSASCLLILGFEGRRRQVDEDMQRARALMADAGGIDGGEGPGQHWLENRYNVSFKQSPMFDAGAFVDTMEVATTWTRLVPLYEEVRRSVAPHALVMAHFSHAYREGCSIYFTFAGHKRDPKALDRLYERVWQEALTAVERVGATISHHHGVGYAKRDHMRREHGAGIRLLYGAKDALDPRDILNPGKVLPDRAVVA